MVPFLCLERPVSCARVCFVLHKYSLSVCASFARYLAWLMRVVLLVASTVIHGPIQCPPDGLRQDLRTEGRTVHVCTARPVTSVGVQHIPLRPPFLLFRFVFVSFFVFRWTFVDLAPTLLICFWSIHYESLQRRFYFHWYIVRASNAAHIFFIDSS